MNLASAALVAALLAAPLAGCGESQSLARIGRDPAATGPSSDTRAAPRPHWPKHGCDVHSGSAIDYVREPDGHPTPEQAALAYDSQDRPVTAVALPPRPHRERAVLLVTRAHVIVSKISVMEGSSGWFVDGVERCSH